MKIRLTYVLAAAALALWLVPAPTATAKDDPKAAREKVRKKYKEDKKGFPFNDLRYWVDAESLEDSRWSHEKLQNKDIKNGPQLLAKWTVNTSAGGSLGIEVVVFKMLYLDQVAKKKYSYPFKHWGESVSCADVGGLVEGFYEDWSREAKDVAKKDGQKPKKKKIGPTKEWSAVVGTNPETDERERREWYAWGHGKDKATYVVQIRYGAAVLKNENLMAKGVDFVKAIKEIKDKAVK